MTASNTLPQNVSVPFKNGPMPAALFVPNANNGSNSGAAYPALVVLHDDNGLDDVTYEMATRLTDLGYVTMVPNLFAGAPADAASDAALATYAQSLFDSDIVASALATLDVLAAREEVSSTQLGIVGWGWGGAYALMAAAHDARLRVAVDIGGAISYPVLTTQKPGSPLNFVADIEGALFAAYAGADPFTPAIEVGRLRGRLIEHDKRGEVKIYPDAPSRFWRDPNSPHTRALWLRLENFLSETLSEEAVDLYSASDEYSDDNADSGYPNEESRIHA